MLADHRRTGGTGSLEKKEASDRERKREAEGERRTWRTANRVRSGQAATPATKHLWGYRESKTCMCGAATCDLGHIMTNCRHFGERPWEQRRHCKNGGSSCAMDERRCRHDI